MEELTKRNFHTLSDGLKQQREVNSNQDAEIRILESKIAQLTQNINDLRQEFNLLMVQVKGRGATSRS